MLRRFAFLVSLVALAAGCSQEVDGDDAEESAADTSSEAALSSAEQSQGRNPVLEAARAQGIIGEQSTGYLGFPDATNNQGQLRGLVAEINIKRRAVYTDIAVRNRVTVATVAQGMACRLFRDRVAEGHAYRDESGEWQTRAVGSTAKLPSFCPSQR